MISIARWVAGLVIIALFANSAILIVMNISSGDWLGAFFGAIGLAVLFGAFVTVRSGEPGSEPIKTTSD